eukprot:jgi/Tetstr1/439932/TSEL_028339.t1
MADVGKGNEVLVDIEVGKNSTGKQVLAKSEEAAGKGTEGADPSCCAPGLKLWRKPPPAPPGPQDANFQGTDSAPPPAGVDSGASLPTDSRDNSALPESDNTSPPAEGTSLPDSPLTSMPIPEVPQLAENLTYPAITQPPLTLPPLPSPQPELSVEPTSTPTSTPGEWGEDTTFTEACVSDTSEYDYYCNADCMVNCALENHSGGLLLDSSRQFQAPYCSSLHILDRYKDNACCCSDHVPPSEWSDTIIPCLEGVTEPEDACQAWCELKSETLMPFTSIDCDPGALFCLPFGLTDPDGTMAIECSDSLRCDCDIMT